MVIQNWRQGWGEGRGKLFVIMQRMDRTHSSGIWQPNTAYVAVIDTATDEEIDTGFGGISPFTGKRLKGIALGVENPGTIQYLPENHTLYIQGVGTYPMEGYPGRDTGGIATMDPETYATRVILDDGTRENGSELPWGNFSGLCVVSPTKGYFVGYRSWGDNALYRFTMDGNGVQEASISAVVGFSGKNIAAMEAGAGTGPRGRLWVCNRTDGGLALLNIEDDTQSDFIQTGLPPLKVVFSPLP